MRDTRSNGRRRIVSKPNAITRTRIERGITVQQLATLAGITPAQVYNIESRSKGTRERTAQAIARHLDKRFVELFEIVRPEPRDVDDDEEPARWNRFQMGRVANSGSHHAGT